MSKPLSLHGKFILIAVISSILAVLLYLLKPQIDTMFILFFLFPILIILLGKTAELIIRGLEKISTGPLSLIEPKNTVLLFCYYASLSIVLAILIENSAILSMLNFKPNEWQVALISLGLAFFPRVLSYASGMERARNTLLAILTPLTLTAAVTLFTQPTATDFRLLTLQLCIVGSLIQVIFGDLALYFAGFFGIIHPVITIETISMLDLQRLVHSQLETIQWDRICQILKEAKLYDRIDIIQKILKSMTFFIDESRERKAKYARIVFVDSLIKTVYSEPNLKEELVPYFEALKEDQESEVRARTAYGYGIISRVMPDKCLQYLSELLDDKDLDVLHEAGKALTIILGSDSKAVCARASSCIIKLSLNPVFLDKLMKQASRVPGVRRQEVLVYGSEGELMLADSPELLRLENPILRALKIAYVNSPEPVFEHIRKCSLDKNIRLKVLAATIISDQDFIQNDNRLLQIKQRLEKSKSKQVKNALEFSRFQTILKRFYHSPEIAKDKTK